MTLRTKKQTSGTPAMMTWRNKARYCKCYNNKPLFFTEPPSTRQLSCGSHFNIWWRNWRPRTRQLGIYLSFVGLPSVQGLLEPERTTDGRRPLTAPCTSSVIAVVYIARCQIRQCRSRIGIYRRYTETSLNLSLTKLYDDMRFDLIKLDNSKTNRRKWPLN